MNLSWSAIVSAGGFYISLAFHTALRRIVDLPDVLFFIRAFESPCSCCSDSLVVLLLAPAAY